MQKFSGAKLREARGKRSQTDIAVELQNRGHGTTQTQVSRWESGQEPRKYIREDLATVLGITVPDMYDDVPDDAPFRGEHGGGVA